MDQSNSPETSLRATGDSTESDIGNSMLHRRTFLGAVGSGLLAAVQASPSASQSEADYWTVVALPDTQFYAASEDLLPYAIDQTDWIVDSLDSESIEFVTHEGDMVNNGWSDEQWRRIDGVMSTLDGAVPYSTLPGNHDWASTNDKSSSVRKYTAHFGPASSRTGPGTAARHRGDGVRISCFRAAATSSSTSPWSGSRREQCRIRGPRSGGHRPSSATVQTC